MRILAFIFQRFFLFPIDLYSIFRMVAIAFILTTSSMLSLAFIAGSDVRYKVFVVAEGEDEFQEVKQVLEKSLENVVVYDIRYENNELATLTELNCVRTIVLVYDGDIQFLLQRNVLISLERVDECVLFSRGELPPEEVLQILDSLLRSRLKVAKSYSELISKLPVYRRRSFFSINWDTETYFLLVRAVGVASLLTIFFGAALLSITCFLLRALVRDELAFFSASLTSAFLIFTTIQMAYVVCSSVLEIPLGLHCTKIGSSPWNSLTIIGMLGPFGGGTFPRLFAGLTGFSLSTIAITLRREADEAVCYLPSLRTRLFIASLVLVGAYFAYTISSLNELINQPIVGEVLCRKMINSFAIYQDLLVGKAVPSRGIILYYIGVSLFCALLLARSKAFSAASPIAAVLIAWGLMRVGNLNLEQAMCSSIIGVMLGFATFLLCAAYLSLLNNFHRLSSTDAKKLLHSSEFRRESIVLTCIALLYCTAWSKLSGTLLPLFALCTTYFLLRTNLRKKPYIAAMWMIPAAASMLLLMLCIPTEVLFPAILSACAARCFDTYHKPFKRLSSVLCS